MIVISIYTAKPVLAVQTDWLQHTLFFSYTPSGFHFDNNKPAVLSREDIEKDLRVLRRHGSGLILYATDVNTENILELAREMRFKSVVLGVWTVTAKEEVKHAVDLARRFPKLIKAIAIGNEGLYFKRYTTEELKQAIWDVRRELPKMALATTEPFASYLAEPHLLDCSDQDFLLPTIHPIFETWFTPQKTTQSVDFVVKVVDRLTQLCHKEVLVKETGIPSGPVNQGYSQQQQRGFWKALLARTKTKPGISVALFEAFDAPWKAAEIKKQSGKYDEREGYWGWFHQNRVPKDVAKLLKPVKH